MVTTNDEAKKNFALFSVEDGYVRPVKAAGISPGAGGYAPVTKSSAGNKSIFRLENLAALADYSNYAGEMSDDDYVEIEMHELEPSVDVDPALYEEADRFTEIMTSAGWQMIDVDDDSDRIFNSEVKPWKEGSDYEPIDFDAVVMSAEDRFFGEAGALVPESADSGFGDVAENFFEDAGKSVESAKRRGASERKARSIDSVVEPSRPFSSMSNKNVGQYDVASMQRNILYDFIERNSEDISKATGITGFFKRRALKSKLEDLTYTAALWHLNDGNSIQMRADYKTVREGVLEAFDNLVSSKGLAKAYKAGRTVDAAKEAVDKSLLKYAGPLVTQGASKAEIDAIGTKYAKDSVMPEPVEVVKPSQPESYTGIGTLFKRVAATAALAVTVFTMGTPAVENYSPARVADENVAVADQADDVYVAYSVEATELPNAESPAPATPAPRRARSRVARAQAEAPAAQYSPDAHTNPQAMEVGRIAVQNSYANAADDDEMSERPIQFRTRDGARLAALSMGADVYSFDDSNLRLAPAGEGLDYSRGGSL